MEAKRILKESALGIQPAEILQQLTHFFTDKGWMNQEIHVRRDEKCYRLLCTEKAFVAYRINDNHGTPPGIPGWAVCIVDQERVIENPEISLPITPEPNAQGWLSSLAKGDYEII